VLDSSSGFDLIALHHFCENIEGSFFSSRLPPGAEGNVTNVEKMISKGRAMSTSGKYMMKMSGRRALLSERTLDSPG